MPLTTTTFMGALVRGVNTSIGWGIGQTSQLIVQLVNDPVQNAIFTPATIGSPVYFSFYGLTFNGIFQKWEERRGPDGNPLFEVVVVDPREILDGSQVILGNYWGSVQSVNNVFNAFGYWENIAYGAAQANDGGMPWHKIRDAVQTLANQPSYGSYGGPLTFRGQKYALDLSQLPTTPPYYRIGGGVAASLLELISQVCEDSGCDFFVELVGKTIRVRTVSRANQPPLGTITSLTNSNISNLARSSNGLELRNELTSAFLIGGDVTTLWMTDSITQFFGYDLTGQVIVGTPSTERFYDKAEPPNLLQTVDTLSVPLNASAVSDILGSITYTCSTIEMRLAQVNYESWALYMRQYRNNLAEMIGVTSPFLQGAEGAAAPVRPNLVNDDEWEAFTEASNAVQGDIHAKVMRFYEFVRGTADEYLGRKYLVQLPFVLTSTEDESLRVTTSYEITDGGYLPEGSSPLGLSPLNEDIFKTQDNRFRAFAVFSDLLGADLSKVSPHGAVIENSQLFTEVHTEQRLVLDNNAVPCALVTLSGPLVEEATDNVGDFSIISAILQMTEEQAQRHLQQSAIPLKIMPAVRDPGAIAVPLKSNTLVYGPWYAQGAAGKVRVERDQSLTPWNYGSYEVMNQVANARVTAAVTNQQVAEAGVIELASEPTASIGDTLQAGGPNITNIDVQITKDGISTSYRFQTYTQRYGLMGKSMSERLRRTALAGVELRRSMKASIREGQAGMSSLFSAARTGQAFMERQARAQRRETPHDCIMAFSAFDEVDSAVRQNVHSATMEEALVLGNANSSGDFKNTSIMSFGGLVRPFSTNVSYSGGYMPKLTTPTISGVVPNKSTLNPWKAANDIEVWSWGDTYQGLHAYRRDGDYDNARVLGLRAPLVLVGWGFDTDGNCVPGSGQTWDSDAMVRQDHWKAGPLDCLWDNRRGVWTVHDALKGRTQTSIPANGAGNITVNPLNGSGYTLQVYNWFSTAVASGVKVICNYIATDNRYNIVAADCS